VEPPRLRDVRDGALLVEHPGLPDDDANRAAVALGRALLASAEPGLLDAIPGARALLVLFEPERLPRERLAAALGRAAARGAPDGASSRLLRIPAVYDGEDLGEVARLAGLSPEEAVSRHAGASYRVAFVGFAPGFAYLSGLPSELAVARLSSPRARVPAGSVAIGGRWTGVYPSALPGGWRLIGRTSLRFFDPRADPPSLLRPGDGVRFESVLASQLPEPRAEEVPAPAGRPIFRIVSPGLFSSVQAAPRFGLGSSGVPAGGAMDLAALEAANALVGNPPGAGALEMTLAGPELECLEEAVVAIAGAPIDLSPGAGRVRVPAGRRVRLGRVLAGARAYLAVRGGLSGPSGRLVAGDTVAVGSWPSVLGPAGGAPPVSVPDEIRLRALLGPESDRFPEGQVERFLSSPWRVTPESDRRGLRLEGRPLEHGGDPEIAPSGTAPGSVQVPGSGLPIVLGPDGPVTGGYARIATVIGADLRLLGQARPGAILRFTAVSLSEAILARNKMSLQ
jgi:KipI family sensor histidine kinase inhibitor